MDARLLARRFETERPQLRAVATRLLGSDADADDVVQEAWLRLGRTDPDGIDNLAAWLTTVVSRLCLDRLRARGRARERSWHVEPWRDEPVATEGDPVVEAETADEVSAALLLVLDALSPAERIAFVLHDVFDRPFDEVGDALDRSPEAARKLASRARGRLRGAPAPRRRPGRAERTVVEAWLRAVRGGDLGALLGLLDDDAVLAADYGTGAETVRGGARIARRATEFGRLAAGATPVLAGGRPAVVSVVGGRVVSVMAFEIDDGRVVRLDVLADPQRLAGLRLDGVVDEA